MNRFIIITVVVVLSGLFIWPCIAGEKQPQALKLEQGIFAEETEGDLDKALSIYEAIVKEASANRPIAAEALYRLGVCCLKQSQAKQAQAKECLENLIKNYSDVGDFAEKGRKALGTSITAESEDQPAIPGQIDKAQWEADLLAVQDHNTMAFDLGKCLVEIDPATGYAIAESVWSRLSKDEVKNGVLKAFEFSRHPRVLDVLHLGATDPSMEVRNYAYSYLRNYSYKDFAEDSKAYEEWHKEFTGHPIEEVLKVNSERFVADLKDAEGPQREILARFMRELDFGGSGNKDSYPNKRQYLIDTGILRILDGWIRAPKASDDVIDGVFSAYHSLKPDESFVREKIFPLMDSDNESLKSAVMRYLGEAKAEWAVLPLIKRLSETKDRSSLWNIATSLGELGDPRAIPAMITMIEADNTYDTVYGVGYFGLGKLTGVRYDESHDGKWWREWWNKNKDQLPETARKAEEDPMLIPVSTKAGAFSTATSTPEQALVVPPDQWGLAGNNPAEYEKGAEENGCYLRSMNPGAQQFGTLTRSMSADPYRGKRLRLTAMIKGEGLQAGSGMWLRVDDPNCKVVAFDNMSDRLLMGDVPEKTCEVVLDVPQEGASIHYGVFLAEKGCVHVRDMKLETVGTDVPVTGKKP